MAKFLEDNILQIIERYIEIPEYAQAAVDWWCEALHTQESDFSEEELAGIQAMTGWDCMCAHKSFSEEIERAFRMDLFWEIEHEIDKQGIVRLNADYYPTGLLGKVCEEIGFGDKFSFPPNTTMLVTKDKVTVMRENEEDEVIWSTN